ncbi:Hypothetical protein A7982_05812 [Minicystis rosea]|nr:Hypothetical protein A7982_05812 [Minicystis rosea]
MRGLGAREILVGLGLFSGVWPAVWLWSRIGGDLIDLGLMGRALASPHVDKDRGRKAMMALMGVAMTDVLAGRRLDRKAGASTSRWPKKGAAPVEESITVDRSREEVYRFWRDFRNLPSFMDHLQSVEVIDERRSRWTARMVGDETLSWEAVITDEAPNERIEWRSDEGRVAACGSVRFTDAPGARGTEVHVKMGYEVPRGFFGRSLFKLASRVIDLEVASELRRFKQMMELGEVVRSDASIHRGQHPAQPPKEPPPRLGTDWVAASAKPQRRVWTSPRGGTR